MVELFSSITEGLDFLEFTIDQGLRHADGLIINVILIIDIVPFPLKMFNRKMRNRKISMFKC